MKKTELDHSLVAILRKRANQQPNRPGYVFLHGDREETVTYAELDKRARMIGGYLAETCAPGDRVLLFYPPGIDYIAAFMGCLYARAVAVPLYPPRPNQKLFRVEKVVRNCGARIALTTSQTLSAIEPFSESDALPAKIRLVAADLLPESVVDGFTPPRIESEDLAFLQYTSGSTGTPKGVMITHANLIANEAAIADAFRTHEDDVCVNWLPLYHDMGLIGNLLQPLYKGFLSVLMSPADFIRDPIVWPRAVTRFRGTLGGAPNFAYELLLRKIKPEQLSLLDLSSWRVAYNGAEPVRAQTMTRFSEKFREAGFRANAFYPCYGLAEATLFVAGGVPEDAPRVLEVDTGMLARNRTDAETKGKTATLVGCEGPGSGHRVEIVDPETLKVCENGRVGEIWAAGPSIASGYWNLPEETARSFGATLADDPDTRFLRTGDLGFVREGSLFVTGRIKDLIIIRGRNHYPSDIELAASACHPALQPGGCAAFSITVEDEEQLAVALEVKRTLIRKLDAGEVVQAIRTAVAAMHELQVHAVVLLKPGGIPKTSSGKIRRFAVRDGFLANNLNVLESSVLAGPDPGKTIEVPVLEDTADREEGLGALTRYLRSTAAAVLKTSESQIEPDQPLSGLGMDSMTALGLQHRLESDLGIMLPATHFLEGRGIAELASEAWLQFEERRGHRGIPATDRERDLPLSFSQAREWFLDRLDPDSDAYNIDMGFQLDGQVCPTALRRAFNEITVRHEMLRTRFRSMGDQPVQEIVPELKLDLPLIDVTGLFSESVEDQAASLTVRERRVPFDLEDGSLIRVTLIRKAARRHLLLVTVHHIVFDGWSVGVLLDELKTHYASHLFGSRPDLPDLPVQYADYAVWQRERLAGPVRGDLLNYWRTRLKGAPELLDLPTDRPRPRDGGFRAGSLEIRLPEALSQRVKSLARDRQATLFTTLTAAFKTLLFRYTAQGDICVGGFSANRNHVSIKDLIGFFVNTLVYRTDLSGEPRFTDLIGRVRETVLGALEHGELPFETLLEELRPDRSTSYSPLFQVMFVLQSFPEKIQRLPGLTLDLGGFRGFGRAHFDLTLWMWETENRLAGLLEYKLDLFEPSTMARLADHFQMLLEEVTTDPERAVSALPMMTEPERRRVLDDWNQARVDVPDKTMHGLFEERAERAPDAAALVLQGKRITYGALNRRASALAGHLREMGVGPGSVNGVFAERSFELYTGILGTLKAGAAYLPLDPVFPDERLSFMVRDAEIAVLLVQDGLDIDPPETEAPIHGINRLADTVPDPAPALTGMDAGDPAYLIYTSGSMGRPKGVVITHRNAVNAYAAWQQEFRLLDGVASHLQMASISFDVFSGDLLRALCSGARLVLCRQDMLLAPERLYAYMSGERVGCAEFVPAVFRNLFAYLKQEGGDLDFMKVLIIGSDIWYVKEYQSIRDFLDRDVRLINSYGVTEATIDSTYFEGSVAHLSGQGMAPIGHPFPNTRLYVLDKRFEPVPVGVAGELVIGGEGVGRMYHARPDLTAERFVPDPFAAEPGFRLYRSGDRARFLENGAVELTGRIDNQVKIRGFRIEPGEIEAEIRRNPSVRDAAVVAKDTGSGVKRLAAYVVFADVPEGQPVPDDEFRIADLRTALKTSLPDYMIPSLFVVLATMPLTPNGKIDRSSLPEPDFSRSGRDGGYEPPRTPTEEILSRVFSECLEVERVGVHDNFFDLGGHSLLLTKAVARIRDIFHIELPLRIFFEMPTVAEISLKLDLGDSDYLPPVVPVSRDEVLPLSFAQERLWFLTQLEPDMTSYHVPRTLRVHGPFGALYMERAYNALIDRHEVLRTTFPEIDGRPIQQTHKAMPLSLPVLDLSGLEEEAREPELMKLIGLFGNLLFYLDRGPLLRAVVVRIKHDDHTAIQCEHHLVHDGWTETVLVGDLLEFHRAYALDVPHGLPDLSIQFADFAYWQRNWLKGDEFDRQLAYWKNQLRGAPALLEMPTDRPRPSVQSFRGEARNLNIPGPLIRRLERVGQRYNATLFMVVLSGFKTLLARYTGQDDIVVGSVVANRRRQETEGMIGMVLNTVALRTDLSENPRFCELLDREREVCLGAYSHQDFPFEKVVEALRPERTLSHTPLFQAAFAFYDLPVLELGVPGVTWEVIDAHNHSAKFDLSFVAAPEANENGDAWVQFEWATDLFDTDTMLRFWDHFLTILDSAAVDPECSIMELPLLSERERTTILTEWSHEIEEISSDWLAHRVLEAGAARYPETTALVFPAEGHDRDEEVTIGYGELNRRANQLARSLREWGAGPEVLVGICLERDLDMVTALFAVLKSGAAYVPLDPDYPEDRLEFMIGDSQTLILLTQVGLAKKIPAFQGRTVFMDRDWDVISTESGENPEDLGSPDDLAYIIYTSGTTGRPKGVMVERRNLGHFIAAVQARFGFDETDAMACFAPFSFDIFMFQLMSPLAAGGVSYFLTRDQILNLPVLAEIIDRLTVFHGPPALMRRAVDHIREDRGVQTGIRKAFVGGDLVPPELIADMQRVFPEAQIYQGYGPTEATIMCSNYAVPRDGSMTTHVIGTAMNNAVLRLYDAYGNLVPVGVPGEIYIGGASVARGYLNRDRLTHEKFVTVDGMRFYRSGDLGRYLADGTVDFLGRIDSQVKIRGYRIELGEIEANLNRHDAVAESVVLARDFKSGDKQLAAYLRLRSGRGEQDQASLRQELNRFLAGKLPEYMIPTAFVVMDAFPLTPNGKLDRAGLPDPLLEPDAERHVGPRTPVEKMLAGIWSEVLGKDSIGVHDNFFELGGHSLLATQVVSRIRKVWGADLPVKRMFEAPTVAGLASGLDTRSNVSEQNPRPIPRTAAENPRLSFAQQRLWFLHQFGEGNLHDYNIPIVLRIEGRIDAVLLEDCLSEITRRHESLRTHFESIRGVPRQVVREPRGLEVPVMDLTGLTQTEMDREIDRLSALEAEYLFDLGGEPLIRVRLIRETERRWLLLCTMHHIIADGWSGGVLLRELAALYAAGGSKARSGLAEPSLQYGDYAEWQRDRFEKGELEDQRAYWIQRLSGAPSLLDLPTDRPRPAIQTTNGARIPFEIGPDLKRGLDKITLDSGTTLFMTLEAIFALLLSRYSHQEDILVGTPIANRNHVEIEPLIGFFVNTLVLRNDLTAIPRYPGPGFSDLLRHTKEHTLEAYANQDMPFEQVVEAVKPERRMSHGPLFQVMFDLQNAPMGPLALPGFAMTPLSPARVTAKCDLTLTFSETDESLHGAFIYNTDLFDAATIRSTARHFEHLVRAIIEDPESDIQGLSPMSETEQRQILETWNGAPLDVGLGETPVHQLIEAHAAENPDRLALVSGSTHLTYAAMNARANRVARCLTDLGAGPEIPVAICLPRSRAYFVSVLAVLKAGSAFVPLDPAYPKKRLDYMVEDSRAPIVVTNPERVPDFTGTLVFCPDLAADEIAGRGSEDMHWIGDARNPAYVLYTSGSTGKAKAASITHRTLTSFMTVMHDLMQLKAHDRMLQLASLCFDVSIKEIFPALTMGAALVLRGSDWLDTTAAFCNGCARFAVSTCVFPTAYWREIAADPEAVLPRSMRLVNFGGEKVEPGDVVRWRRRYGSGMVTYNNYGPTEASVATTRWRFCPASEVPAEIPIGKPYPNAVVYVADPRLRAVPAGVTGELLISGISLARGYHRRPDLTAAKFVPNPFLANETDPDLTRIYRTGDLARWTRSGELMFVGRIDKQVKLRGFRIELGEIRAVLADHSLVAECEVMIRDRKTREGQTRDRRLAAYVVLEERETGPDDRERARALRDYLRERLPDYMVPAAVVVMDAFPLTPNGKIDFESLPEPGTGFDIETFVAPKTPVEEMIASIWGEVLGLERVGARDNFFELGGHSLLVTQVVSRIREAFSIELPVRRMFDRPTVAELGPLVEEMRQEGWSLAAPIARIADRESFPLSYAQQRLWLLNRTDPANPAYNMPAAFMIKGDIDPARIETALQILTDRHETLRTNFRLIDAEPRQVIATDSVPAILIVDLVGLDPEIRDAETERAADREAKKTFDLAGGNLWRTVIFRLTRDQCILVFNMHHIISDGWSMSVLVREFVAVYEASRSGADPALPELEIQYADFGVWQQNWLRDEVLDKQTAYWSDRLEDVPFGVDLVTDHPRPKSQTHRGGVVHFGLAPELVRSLRALSGAHGATLFMTLLAGLKTLFHRYSGQRDLVIGTAVANRNRREIETLIGFFVNSLVIRTDVSGDPEFTDYLGQVRDVTMGAYDHQDLPFNLLVETLRPDRVSTFNPMYNIMFALQNMPDRALKIPGLTIEPLKIFHHTSKFDMFLSLTETPDGGIQGGWEYHADLFQGETIARMADHFTALLGRIAAEPGLPISAYPLVGADERDRLLHELNRTATPYPRDRSVVALFEEQVDANPDRTALVCGPDQRSYRALDRAANGLAHELRNRGLREETPVAICLNRSPEMIVALLAVLKAGGFYVGIDAKSPGSRIERLVKDAGIEIAVTHAAWSGKIPDRLTLCDLDDPNYFRGRETGPDIAVRAENLAYASYTSGSTGIPKGVCIGHRAVVRLVRDTNYIVLGPDEILFHLAALAFDASTLEIWGGLLNGGRLAVMTHQEPSLAELGLAIRQYRVTTMWLTATLFNLMTDHHLDELRGVRQLFAGGEALSVPHIHEAFTRLPETRIVNGYGPTENTTFTCTYPVEQDPKNWKSIPIGTPIANTRVHVLDRGHEPAPTGVPGELMIGGDGLARGYLGDPVLTADRFVPDPHTAEPGQRLYRSGDLVRRLDNGSIQFLGRIDHQIKLRGFRIELGEIESLLADSALVETAAARLIEYESGEKAIAAYVTPKQEEADAEDRAKDETAHRDQWQMVFDQQVYSDFEKYEDPTLNLSGWISTYTGEPIPRDEMVQWVEDTTDKIRFLKPESILEIGCGTGLLLFRLAPGCRTYFGTDISEVALDHVRAHLARPGLGDVEISLQQRSAEQWDDLPAGAFDLVLLNSVAQYFPGIDYLLDVVANGLTMIGERGSLFLGDIRNFALLEHFQADLALDRLPEETPVSDWVNQVREGIEEESEMLVDPGFFLWLKHRFPCISAVEVLHKRGTAYNELTRFRYDVRIHAGPVETLKLDWRDWTREALDPGDVRRVLEQDRPETLGLLSVPNARLSGYGQLAAVYRGEHDGPRTTADLNEIMAFGSGVDPELFWETGRALGYQVRIYHAGPDARDRCHVVFLPLDEERIAVPPVTAPSAETALAAFANRPMKEIAKRKLVSRLRPLLETHLPEYMVPRDIVVLDAFPLTAGGKINRLALPVPVRETRRREDVVAYRTETEALLAGIWSKVLDIEHVGTTDNFFELGGHSLGATQVVSAIREAFRIELPLRQLFEAPTVEALARVVEKTRHEAHGLEATRMTRLPRTNGLPPARLPLSFAQQRLWFLSRIEPENPFYNTPAAVHFKGELNLDALTETVNALIARHESLRTLFTEEDGVPTQTVHAAPRVSLPLENLSRLTHAERETRLEQRLSEEAAKPFDLENGPLFRVMLFKRAENDHVFLMNLHHIINDGWSVGVLVKEVSQLYKAFHEGKTPRLPELAVQYPDFSVWQRGRLQGEALDRRLAYWQEKLGGPLPVLDPPSDYPRPPIQTFGGDEWKTRVPRPVAAALHRLAQAESATLFMVLLTGFKILLARYTGLHDLIVGTPIANRNRAEVEGLIGFFVNTLALRTDLGGNPSFRDALQRVRDTTLSAYMHQDVPFEMLVENLDVARDLSRSPIFQVMCQLVNTPSQNLSLPGLTLEKLNLHNRTAKFDLSLHAIENADGLTLSWEYRTDLFSVETIKRYDRHLLRLLTVMAQDPGMIASEYSVLDDEERHQILVGWNRTESAYPDKKCIHHLFEAAAARTPDGVAVKAPRLDPYAWNETGSDRFGETTYRELNAWSNRLARLLRERGIGIETPVGVCMERSPDMIASLLAVLKAGGAYVPLDPGYPRERLNLMLRDSAAPVVLTGEKWKPQLSGYEGELLDVARADETGPSSNLNVDAVSEQTAYIIYTSGSTGVPKGVSGTHRGTVNRLAWMWRTYPFEPGETCSWKTSLNFVDSVWEIFGPILRGVPVLTLPGEVVQDVPVFINALRAGKVTRLVLVPSLLRVMLDTYPDLSEQLPNLRLWMTSGETIPKPLAERFRKASPRAVLLNLYGSSEVAADVTAHQIRDELTGETVPIGKPIANTRIFILDRRLEPVPVGVAGVVHVAGEGLARDYRGRPDLTAASFIPDPFSDRPGGRLFRTGDLGTYLANGSIAFKGRADRQIKIRGFRVELDEIEAVLGKHERVLEAAVLLPTNPDGDPYLAAYARIAPELADRLERDKNAWEALEDELYRFLKERLPDYMTCRVFTFMAAFPLTPNGKINRRALPDPENKAKRKAHVAPRNPIEEELARIWSEILQLERVGVHDDFFELGGHSLLATQAVSKINKAFGIELRLNRLFEKTTIAALGRYIQSLQWATREPVLETAGEGEMVEGEL